MIFISDGWGLYLGSALSEIEVILNLSSRVRNLKFTTYLKFATCENTNKINELW